MNGLSISAPVSPSDRRSDRFGARWYPTLRLITPHGTLDAVRPVKSLWIADPDLACVRVHGRHGAVGEVRDRHGRPIDEGNTGDQRTGRDDRLGLLVDDRGRRDSVPGEPVEDVPSPRSSPCREGRQGPAPQSIARGAGGRGRSPFPSPGRPRQETRAGRPSRAAGLYPPLFRFRAPGLSLPHHINVLTPHHILIWTTPC